MPCSIAFRKYDRYADGKPAILRHTDGSGFAYYPSGRKVGNDSADSACNLCKQLETYWYDNTTTEGCMHFGLWFWPQNLHFESHSHR